MIKSIRIVSIIIIICLVFSVIFLFVLKNSHSSQKVPGLVNSDRHLFISLGETFSDGAFVMIPVNTEMDDDRCQGVTYTNCSVIELVFKNEYDEYSLFTIYDKPVISNGKIITWRDPSSIVSDVTLAEDMLVFDIRDQALNQPTIMKGTFEDFEFGDYGHLTVRDEMGNPYRFWLDEIPYETLNIFIDGDMSRKEMQGKPVIVTWERRKGFIPESGPDSYQDVITDIREVKE